MQLEYGRLGSVAAALARSAEQVRAEPRPPSGLGSASPRPDEAHELAAGHRTWALQSLSSLLAAQSLACAQLIAAFRLLDEQVSLAVERGAAPPSARHDAGGER